MTRALHGATGSEALHRATPLHSARRVRRKSIAVGVRPEAFDQRVDEDPPAGRVGSPIRVEGIDLQGAVLQAARGQLPADHEGRQQGQPLAFTGCTTQDFRTGRQQPGLDHHVVHLPTAAHRPAAAWAQGKAQGGVVSQVIE